MFSPGSIPQIPPEPVDSFLREKDNIDKNRKENKRKSRLEVSARDSANAEVQIMIPLGEIDLQRVHRILCGLRVMDRSQAGASIYLICI